MRARLNLGERLALLRAADESPAELATLCARHGVTTETLAAWREEFRRANIREVHLAELRSVPTEAASPEARELWRRLASLESLLRRRTAEIHALREQLRTTAPSPLPSSRTTKDMTHA
jgi:transposase-like protein